MSSKVYRGLANLLIWVGLALIVFGCAMAYPFVYDAIQAQSGAPASLSFVVTLEPTHVDTLPATPTGTPAPPGTTSTRILTPASTATAPPAPALLPDDATTSRPLASAQAPVEASPTIQGEPPDRMVIPAIRLDAPVIAVGWHVEQIGGVSVSVWDVPNRRAAGWLKTSAPAGQKGNTVLDGHHNIDGEVFRYLVDLRSGDEIDLGVGNTVYRYGVTEKHILPDRDQPMAVRIANAKWIQPTDDERLTLVTCWPYTTNTHRLVIVARPLALLPSHNGRKPVE